ncbi:gamma-glutamyltransferase [Thermovibrio ammonificans HB-1]|uniref:Gamma-glutamyltransferase n=1 Tax=Thermovibrio ammonificans (strain DSM 15698 / JCM 12110 / HB-1) TaxID=648996 RepID=E8T635_THEA1|nr:gamma-glutamyltransferase [Thermovibrio ammonificans]ADU96619.1 gamma-glutamyltransferase [Thermovibrio ammonificans HB-1]
MRGVVAAGDRLTAEAGAEVLRAGGNAFDAAVAACFAAPMAEPALTSAGGGGFLLAVPASGAPVLYDFFVDVPPVRSESPDFYPVLVDFGDAVQEFHIGMASVAVPGFVAGLLRVHSELGRLPLREVLQPAIEYAKKGVRLSELQASFVKLLEPIFMATPEARRLYAPGGKLIDSKTTFRNPDYAGFLEALADEGQWLFYEGDVADRIEALSVSRGGHIRKEDLARYKVVERKPLSFKFGGRELLTNPPPSSGGVLIAFTLGLLNSVEFDGWGTPLYAGALIEAMATTEKFRKEQVDENLHELNGFPFAEDLVESYGRLFKRRLNLWGNTTHISVLDAEGNGASVTTTNGEGSGVVVDGIGVMLNNMLGEEDLNPKGFFRWPPYVRLPSMMAPTAVLSGGGPELLLGSAGSNRIRSAIVEVLVNYLALGLPVDEAVSLPRLHYEKGEVFMEPGFPEEIVEAVKRHYKLSLFRSKNLFFGGVQAVVRGLKGAGDERRGGAVVVV